jgi:repressor LexA
MLTERQQQIWNFLVEYVDRHGYPPTVREIGSAVGLTSSSTVHAHLANLEKIGLLRRDPTKPRAIELLKDQARKVLGPSGLPVVGHVAAGAPILAEEQIEEYVELPAMIGGESGDFILRVKGDSMKDAGILEDDYVVVRSGDEADNGEIVVAMIEDEATVKRFFREKDRVRLQPENKAYKPIRTADAKVVGRVVGVFRAVA